MFGKDAVNLDTQDIPNALESLLEMKANVPAAIIQQRASRRIEIRAHVTARPGNSSQRHQSSWEGVTGDISRDGCQVLFPRTMTVGDIYWLTFEDKSVVDDAVLARCVRCRFIREDAFETGFKFFERIQLCAQE